MQTPLVVFIPEKERGALRSSGVLPPSWFEMCGDTLWNGTDDRIYLWPNPPVYGTVPMGAGSLPPPAQMLGLETKGDEWMRSENLVAKLFGATVLHVLFLDDEVADKPGFADMAPLMELVRWVRTFGDSIRTWFADTQNRNIRHVVVVVARNGAFHLTEEQRDAFSGEFSEKGVVKTCFLVNARLEVGLGHDALHAKCLWPVIVGRLLLRMLIELSTDNPSNGIFLPGVHLIRSFEYLIDCPNENIEELKEQAQHAVYRVIHLEPPTAGSDESAQAQPTPRVSNPESDVFPGLPTTLSSFGAPQRESGRVVDWHREIVDELVQEAVNDSRWAAMRERARADFAARERRQFLEKEKDRVMEAGEIFGRVANDPGNIRNEERALQEKAPTDTFGADVIYEKWKEMVKAERTRKEAQRTLKDAGREMVRAQNHYVTAPYGILAVMATSLFCGYALVRILWAAGGSGSLLVSIVLSAISAVGAVCAWLTVTCFHRRAGRLAMNELKKMAEDVDANMDERHAAAVATVRTAETRHRIGLRRGAIAVLQRLLARVGRIVDRELQSPTADVFYREPGGDEKVEARQAQPEGGDVQREELAVFRERTRFSHSLGDKEPEAGLRGNPNVEKVITEAFTEPGDRSFRTFWERLCAETDGLNRQGNFPAQVFVPRIREWFRNFGGRLVMALKLDLIADAQDGNSSAQQVDVLPPAFKNLRGDTGFALASTDVESIAVACSPKTVFVPKSSNLFQHASNLLSGGDGGIEVRETEVLDVLPQVAIFFQDIRVWGIGRDEDGRLLFLSKNKKLVRKRSESEVA